MTDFSGRWFTTFGTMELEQDGTRVHGSYQGSAGACPVEGTVAGGKLDFHYQEPGEQGEGWFELKSHGQFAGQYRPDGQDRWHDWTGTREWEGVWETTFGRLRLIQDVGRIHGFYEGVGPSTIEGRLDGERLVFHFREPSAAGEGWFELDAGARSFAGQWRQDGLGLWSPWVGRRVPLTPGLTWLIVIEAHWQRSFADREYAFGNMLREFFARLEHVVVRQRIFNDEASLERWCRELIYFPEPAVVLIASHGTPEGLSVHGRSINTELVLGYLRHASNIKLLHFSSCLVMKSDDVARRIPADVAFPISGYTTSVDWGGSAIIEFNYLDMILTKGLAPHEAAALLPTLVAYAGAVAPEASPYPAAGFRFFGVADRRDDDATVIV